MRSKEPLQDMDVPANASCGAPEIDEDEDDSRPRPEYGWRPFFDRDIVSASTIALGAL